MGLTYCSAGTSGASVAEEEEEEEDNVLENTGKFISIEVLEAIGADILIGRCIWGVGG